MSVCPLKFFKLLKLCYVDLRSHAAVLCLQVQNLLLLQALPVHHAMAKYLLELSLIDYDMCHYAPSLISAAAIYLALW